MRRPSVALILIAAAALAVVLAVRVTGDAPSDIAPTTSVAPDANVGQPDTTAANLTTSTTAWTGLTVPVGSTACDLYGTWAPTGTVTNTDLTEASGLAVSRTTPGVLWSHNDSRDGPRLYAFRSDGTDLGVFDVPGGFAFDWEDMAAGPDANGQGNFLYMGDIGDNFDIREGVIALHRVEDLDPASMTDRFPHSDPIALEYPEGNHDAEALFIDPIDPSVYIITKSRDQALVYRGSIEVNGARTRLELMATLFLGAEVSGADISPDGSVIALRGYRTVWMWTRSEGQTIAQALAAEPCEGQSPTETQGESIAFDTNYSYWTVSEGLSPAVHRVPFDG
ncbi:MAG: hypothetical protein O3B42_05210 [Actinomycetota bacterium]|nr:hypothetical protein [Actinomycetota bacterium]